jgi:hypothetical protein
MNTSNIQNEPTSFNISLDKLPFDILGLIFSFVLSASPSDDCDHKNMPPTLADRFQLNQLAMVSRRFCQTADLFENVPDVERILSVLFKVLTLDDPVGDAMDIFDECRDQLPFSQFSSFEHMLEFAFYFSDKREHANFAYKWVEHLVQKNSVSPSFACTVLIRTASTNTRYWRTISHLLSQASSIPFQVFFEIRDTCRSIIYSYHVYPTNQYASSCYEYSEGQLYMKNIFYLFRDRFRTLFIALAERNNVFIRDREKYLDMFDLLTPEIDCEFTCTTDPFMDLDTAKQVFGDKFDFSDVQEQIVDMPIILPVFGTDVEYLFY